MTTCFRALVVLTACGIPLYSWIARGRVYGIFAVVILLVSLPGAVVMQERYAALAGPLAPVVELAFIWGVVATAVHLASLVTARLRSATFRYAISIPGMAFVSAGALAGVWLLALIPLRVGLGWLGLDLGLATLRWLDLVPFVVATISVATSLRPAEEIVRVERDEARPPAVTRLPVARYRMGRREPPALAARPLRIVQIADPHLGPWQPVAKLRRVIEDLLRHDPDLVLLTGDFLTMEGSGTAGALTEALAPLRGVTGRAYAVFGNHDHDHGAPMEVRTALAANGVRLLVDEALVVATAAGPVQLVGADYVGRGRREHIQQLLRAHPRQDGHLRLLLLHDPSIFRHIPAGEVDLTLSGHTHGGQLGLVSLGLDWTVLAGTAWPDHGLFGHGSNRLYVHRGTGFYGFPLRIGVPGEASLLEIIV